MNGIRYWLWKHRMQHEIAVYLKTAKKSPRRTQEPCAFQLAMEGKI